MPRGVNYTGNLFFGEQGYMVLDPAGYQVYRSMVKVTGDEIPAAGAGAGGRDRFEKTMEGTAEEQRGWDTTPHMKNFLDAVKPRDRSEAECGHRNRRAGAGLLPLGQHFVPGQAASATRIWKRA